MFSPWSFKIQNTRLAQPQGVDEPLQARASQDCSARGQVRAKAPQVLPQPRCASYCSASGTVRKLLHRHPPKPGRLRRRRFHVRHRTIRPCPTGSRPSRRPEDRRYILDACKIASTLAEFGLGRRRRPCRSSRGTVTVRSTARSAGRTAATRARCWRRRATRRRRFASSTGSTRGISSCSVTKKSTRE